MNSKIREVLDKVENSQLFWKRRMKFENFMESKFVMLSNFSESKAQGIYENQEVKLIIFD